MTRREFLQIVIATVESFDPIGKDLEEIRNFAQEEIQKLDERNASRSSKPTKLQVENKSIKCQILKVLYEPMVASAIGRKVGISTQKASALCRQLVNEGKLQVEEVKVPKKGKQKVYSVIQIKEE